MEFYISPQSGQFYMINVLENQWLSVTYISLIRVYTESNVTVPRFSKYQPMADDETKSVTSESNYSSNGSMAGLTPYYMDIIDHAKSRYPHCIVWTPIPLLT